MNVNDVVVEKANEFTFLRSDVLGSSSGVRRTIVSAFSVFGIFKGKERRDISKVI